MLCACVYSVDGKGLRKWPCKQIKLFFCVAVDVKYHENLTRQLSNFGRYGKCEKNG